MERKNNKKSYWPHFIIASFIFIVVAGILTIKVALDNPVEMDNFYFEKYQIVDRDINDIILMQREFDKNYKFEIENRNLIVGKNLLKFKITDLNNSDIKNALVKILVTRPDTSKFDKKFEAKYRDGFYQIDNVEIPKIGRWLIQSKIEINKLTGFFKREINATK